MKRWHFRGITIVMLMILVLSGCKREIEYRDVQHQIESEAIIL